VRAIKRYLATRTDRLPWLFVSERGAQLTRQAVNYVVRLAGEKAKLGRVRPHMLRHSCGTTWPTGALIYARCRITLATEIPSRRPTIRELPGIGSRGCGDDEQVHDNGPVFKALLSQVVSKRARLRSRGNPNLSRAIRQAASPGSQARHTSGRWP
jgi:Phage integrase family